MAVFKKKGQWWIDYYDEHGERKRKKVGRSKKVAQNTLEEIKTQVRQRKLGIAQALPSKPVSVREFFFQNCFEYFDTNLSKRTAKRYKSALKHFYHFLRQSPKVKRLSQLNQQHFEKYKAHRKSVPFPKEDVPSVVETVAAARPASLHSVSLASPPFSPLRVVLIVN